MKQGKEKSQSEMSDLLFFQFALRCDYFSFAVSSGTSNESLSYIFSA